MYTFKCQIMGMNSVVHIKGMDSVTHMYTRCVVVRSSMVETPGGSKRVARDRPRSCANRYTYDVRGDLRDKDKDQAGIRSQVVMAEDSPDVGRKVTAGEEFSDRRRQLPEATEREAFGGHLGQRLGGGHPLHEVHRG